jgi:RimJ/RimL family protein N-acetyltransferase
VQELETDRLLLRRFTDEDRAPFAAINADPEVTRYLSGPMSREESDEVIDRCHVHWDRWGYGIYAIDRLDPAPEFIGYVGLSHHRALPDDVEIGWRLARPVWGLGLATEAAAAVRDAAFQVLGLQELVSITTDENVASRRVMEKLGFRFDRYQPFQHWLLRIAVLDAGTAQGSPPQ